MCTPLNTTCPQKQQTLNIGAFICHAHVCKSAMVRSRGCRPCEPGCPGPPIKFHPASLVQQTDARGFTTPADSQPMSGHARVHPDGLRAQGNGSQLKRIGLTNSNGSVCGLCFHEHTSFQWLASAPQRFADQFHERFIKNLCWLSTGPSHRAELLVLGTDCGEQLCICRI